MPVVTGASVGAVVKSTLLVVVLIVPPKVTVAPAPKASEPKVLIVPPVPAALLMTEAPELMVKAPVVVSTVAVVA